MPRWLLLLLALLVLQRIAYHAGYFALDPFAWVPVSDGQVYESAARDILVHPPLGSEPLYLQGLYAYLLACGSALFGHVVGGLYLQIAIAAVSCALFAVAAAACFGAQHAALSLALLLASPSLPFYDNKYLSVSLGISTCMLLLWALVRAAQKPTGARALLLGVCAGLALLGRPNLLLALPFGAYALWSASSEQRPRQRLGLLSSLVLGCVLALLPLGLRNLQVTGRFTVFPSHGGGIPFFIGNNPDANGRWNDAGGLLTGQVVQERRELAERLGLSGQAVDDDAIGAELYRRAFAFIRDEPSAYLLLELKKLWYMLGNHHFVRDYDLLGERELLGPLAIVGLPFGVLLGLALLGGCVLWRETRAEGAGALPWRRCVALMLLGMVCAVTAANLLWFTSAQNRAPLLVPFAFVAGPGLAALPRLHQTRAGRVLLASAALLTLSCFVPRSATVRPSSVHYYNLANAEELLGQQASALTHYAQASEQNPRQPMFWLRRAQLARKLGRSAEARYALQRMAALPDLPGSLRRAIHAEVVALDSAQPPAPRTDDSRAP